MQDEKTLELLGFQKDKYGDMVFVGQHRTLVTHVLRCNGPVYVELFLVSDKIDERELSPTKGRPLLSRIKDCCSNGSVERAIKKYDLSTA